MSAQQTAQDVQHTAQQVLADTAAAVSVTAAGWSWLAEANELAQFIATLVAIIAGGAAAWWHLDRTLAARRERAKRDITGGD